MTTEKSDTPLLPCPFCGTVPPAPSLSGGAYEIQCDVRDCWPTVRVSMWTKDEAIFHWNRRAAESAQAPNSDGVERPFIHAFSIKRGKEDGVWYLHGEELVPGLNLVGKNLADVLADLVPAWKRLYEVSPQQVPSPNEMDER